MSDKKRLLIFDLLLAAVFVIADQAAKAAAVAGLKDKEDLILIKGALQLHYLENRGAAFSMLQNATPVFIIAAAVMFIVMGYVLVKVPVGKKYFPWHIFCTMIAAGGVGNLIDRIRLGYVIDFIYFSLIDFPVFNVADICVTVGVALICGFILFVWKEEDMKFLSGHDK
ncbi:MAG: signal peptidase II [Lachnospiraceae bacterium]|nr:signal peptidase II [Lachnospiraceae bacterium]